MEPVTQIKLMAPYALHCNIIQTLKNFLLKPTIFRNSKRQKDEIILKIERQDLKAILRTQQIHWGARLLSIQNFPICENTS